MAGGNAIRGTRVGAGPMGEAERGEAAPRRRIPFWCANGHDTHVAFASDADVPELWDCPRCGLPAGQDQQNPPPAPRTEPYKTHLAYVPLAETRVQLIAGQRLRNGLVMQPYSGYDLATAGVR